MEPAKKEKPLINRGSEQGKARILVAPLDWGLGHATRCIPIIRELLAQDCEVLLAGEGAQEALLKTEFPELTILPLEGYRVRYAKSATGMLRNILLQTPAILRSIKKENSWLKKIKETHAIHAVISDNRYGLYHESIPCIFITHQLAIKTPFGKWPEKVLQKRNYRYINRFLECWVPDEAGQPNLAGELSHPALKPNVPVYYIGPLSRFSYDPLPVRKDHLLILLSGPEPQRSILENKLINQVAHYNGTATIVRGLPDSSTVIPSTNMLKFYNHLPAAELAREVGEAGWVIARSGYSSVMDLLRLRKKTILVPTPGQPEQEYLGRYLLQERMALTVSQKEFSLTQALEQARGFQYELPLTADNHILNARVAHLISIIKQPGHPV